MKFCIVTVARLNSFNVDTANFRKSKKAKVIVQLEKLQKKHPNAQNDKYIAIYDHNSPELIALLNTADWQVV